MPINMRQTQKYTTKDAARWVKDVKDFSSYFKDIFNEMVNSEDAINSIISSSVAMNAVLASSTAMNAVAASSTAMNAVTSSSTAMNAVAASSTAMNAIMSSSNVETWWSSQYYVGKGLATYASLSHADLDGLNTISDIANNSTAMSDIVNSSTAMNAVAASSTAMNAIANSSTAMNAIAGSSTAMNVVANSSTAMNTIAGSTTAMNAIWNVDSARQALWASATARLALWNNISALRTLTVNSDPNLVSETPLNTDATAGYLTKASKNGAESDWTAVDINDENKYIVWIHFYSSSSYDWFTGKIASYDQTTDLQVTNGGSSLTRGNCQATSNGLWVWFHNNGSGYSGLSYARVWYIKV